MASRRRWASKVAQARRAGAVDRRRWRLHVQRGRIGDRRAASDPLVTIIFNNDAYGNVRTMQIRDYDERVIATDLLNPDFVKLGESFGANAFRAEDGGQLRMAMRYGFASELPTIIEVPIGETPSLGSPARSGSDSPASLQKRSVGIARHGPNSLILPLPDSAIYRKFSQLIEEADRVFFAGLPGVGKSLLLQQLALDGARCRTPGDAAAMGYCPAAI